MLRYQQRANAEHPVTRYGLDCESMHDSAQHADHLGRCRVCPTDISAFCRDVTEQREPFPSFSPDDFDAAQDAANTALQLAQKAATADPDSTVRAIPIVWQISLSCLLMLHSKCSTCNRFFCQSYNLLT